MELLGMVPAEAIALRLYSLPAAAAGSLCAWLVAALAAAVGLWRIRAGVTASSSKPAGGVRNASSLVDDNQDSRAAIDDEPQQRPEAPAAPLSPSASESSTPSKVRFTAYYGGGAGDEDGVVDGVRKCADDADDDDVGVRGRDYEAEVAVLRRTVSEPWRRRRAAATLATAPWEEREMAVRRRSDLGWYRHIDMAALDGGSIVRMWDGDLTAASPRGRIRRAGLELQLSL